MALSTVPGGFRPEPGFEAAEKDPKAPPTVANVEDEDVSQEIYLGVVKSYNDRRGFGFLACTETADRFGRDVYMPKAEATMAALLATGIERETAVQMVNSGTTSSAACSAALAAQPSGVAAAMAAATANDRKEEGEKSSAPRLAEEDLVFFRVRLSVEGYPQAVCVQRLHKLTGSVVRPPIMPGHTGIIKSEEAVAVCGQREVAFDSAAAGQLRAVPGDVVTFCIPEAESKIGVQMVAPPVDPHARMVCLASTERPQGTVLGCFTLDLPRTRSDDGPALAGPNLHLPCHAFGDKLVLAGLPSDLDEHELMKFFGKQGANIAIVAHARTSSFASITFPGTPEVARFLSRVAHAYADEKGTLIARLTPKELEMEQMPTLPALPAPNLSTSSSGEDLEPGNLMVTWSPLVLAVGYTVELRPVTASGSSGSSWLSVDVTSKKLGSSSNRFDFNCSSCVVNSLQIGTAYEARVSYFTDCNTMSEASDPSKPCLPAQGKNDVPGTMPGSVPVASPAPAPAAAAPASVSSGPNEGYSKPFSSTISLSKSFPPPSGPPAPLPALPHGPPLPGLPPALHHPPPHPMHPPLPAQPPWPWPGNEVYPPPDPLGPGVSPGFTSGPSWRSPSGLVVPPPAAPELHPADEYGFALSVRWPAVLQAAAYVVELREADTTSFERFVRSAPEAKLGTLVELRVGGLRPGPAPGRIYMAQVRTVGHDGWESLPSPPGFSVPLPPADDALPSQLSADAPAWQPGLGGLAKEEKWWPPAVLSSQSTDPLEMPGARPSLSWTPLPPPPSAPPTLARAPPPAAAAAAAAAPAGEDGTDCLILD
eukprot:s365_g12.t1